jgi:NADPH-dependent 2,4-dienoyl-CoA reductase/sulfur reductase-like enzyme
VRFRGGWLGVTPNTELLAAAGAEVNNGILVDERCRTSLPDVYAAGDFGPNAAPAPRRIVPSHAMDQVANLGVELRTADRISLDFHRQ